MARRDRHNDLQHSHHERIAMLSDKLCVLHDSMNHDAKVRFEHLHCKMRHFDERLTGSQDASAKKISVMKEQLQQFQQELDVERLARERFAQAKEDEIVFVDAALQEALEREQSAMRDTETRILTVFEEKTAALRDQVTKSGEHREESENSLRHYLEVDIPQLYQHLQQEVQNRESMEQRLLRRAMEEVTQLQAAILAEKKAREDTEEAMLKMMEDVVAKMQTEIANERRERERSEEMLLNLLDSTCAKLQHASHGL